MKLALFILTLPLFANTYTTNFPLTENPISEGGKWSNGGQPPANSWTNCRTTTGLAFGTESISSGTDDDSTCILSGLSWGPNQTATGVVHAVGNYALGLEVELRLRVTFTTNSITGYEIDCTPGEILIVKWLGPINSFTVLASESSTAVTNGNTVVASITGTSTATITVMVNGVQVLQATDSSPYTSGAPGMGFFDRLDSTASDMGFTSFSANDGCSPTWCGVIDPARAIDWSTVGSPAMSSSASWTQCGSTIASGASAATINAALAACTANHYVQLSAGTYNLTTGLTFGQNNNIKLVGAGANQTFLVFSGTNGCQGFEAGVCMASADLNYVLSPSNLANWTANYSAGTTSITLDSKTNMTVGEALMLDQLDDTVDSGNIFVCYLSNGTLNCSTNGDNGGFARTSRGQQQIVTVTSISAGACPCTIGISPGIYMPNWASGKTPQAWWATTPVYNMGVENLSLDLTAAEPSVGTGFAIQMFNCSGCWEKGVRSIGAGRSHTQAQVSTNITVQDSYFFLTAGHTSTSYGIESAGASSVLMQNNIFQQITEPMSLNGSCSGCVEAYNFDINDIYDTGGNVFNWRMASSLPHAVGVAFVLMEGNQGSGIEGDIIHGTHHFMTAFRNAYNGYQQNNGNNPTGNVSAYMALAYNRFNNVVGNVLGTTAFSWTGYTSGGSPILTIGAGESGGTYTVPSDSNVGRTIMLWGNYDVVTSAVRWCGNSSDPGWSTTCSSTSEVPSGISQYPNPVPTSTTLPASFYLSSKPSWWPSAKPWPPIGPDVTGGNMANLAGHANTIPAADCYSNVMGGPANGTGSVLSFNAATCYSGAPPPSSGVSIGGNITIAGGVTIQ
jgi:hypothetical protein